MKRLLAALLLLLLAAPVAAQDFPGQYHSDLGLVPMTDGQRAVLGMDVNRHMRVTGYCNTSVAVSVAAAATQELVALTAGDIVYVCSMVLSADTIATTGTINYGTGTTCGTGTTALTGAMRFADEGNISISGAGGGYLFKGIASNAVCITAATGAITGFVTYAKF